MTNNQPTDWPTKPTNQPTNRPTNSPTHWLTGLTNWPTDHLHQAKSFLRSSLFLTGMKVQWGRSVREILLDESNHTYYIQCCIAAAPEKTLVLLASLLCYLRCYLDPEFAHNHNWEVPYWQSGGTAYMRKTTDLKFNIKITKKFEIGQTLTSLPQ